MTSKHATMVHIAQVGIFLAEVCSRLRTRAELHDASKLEEPELSTFDRCTERLSGLTYGSADYADCLADMKPALEHHYKNNRHHPEHHANGVSDMTLIDMIEMLADWKAATLRHNDGDIARSIDINRARFRMSDELSGLLIRTAKELGWI